MSLNRCKHGNMVGVVNLAVYECPLCAGESAAPLTKNAGSGFEDIPGLKRTCTHPDHHLPNPLMMSIPAGQRYRHVCPVCGHTEYAYGSTVSYGELR